MAEYSGYDTILAAGDGATPTEAFAAVAQVRDIEGPAPTTDDIDVTHRGGNNHKMFLPGLIDDGDISFDVIYDPSIHDTIITDQNDRTVRNWKLTFPDTPTTTVVFPGYVKTFSIKSPMSDAFSADVTIKVAGDPTWA